MIILISALLALANQSAVPGQASGGSKGDITVSTGPDVKAGFSSSITARCGSLELQITSEAAGGTARQSPSTKISLNGRAISVEGTALSEILQRGDGLRKFVPFCEGSPRAIRVRIYSVRKPAGQIIYSVGSFIVEEGGATSFHGEEQVSPEDFWFG